METARAEIPDMETRFREGEFGSLLAWLQRNVYLHGRKFTPDELLQRVTNRPLTPTPWINYARQKFGTLYGLD
jgi:carboxypeptidase Taq